MPDARCPMPDNSKRPTSDIGYRISGIGYRVSGIGSVLLAFVDTKPCLSRYLSDPLDLHYSPDCSSADRYRREIFTFSDDRPVPAESSATASTSARLSRRRLRRTQIDLAGFGSRPSCSQFPARTSSRTTPR